jgi:hypothetical protein
MRALGFAAPALLWIAACAEGASRDHYFLTPDPASRQRWPYVMERKSLQWVHLHCELRVPLERTFPDPVTTPESGDLMSTQYMTPQTMQTGDVVPAEFKLRDGYRVWLSRSLAHAEDLKGTSSLGVRISYPSGEPGPLRSDPMEIFHLPPLPQLTPYVWSPWHKADEVRSTFFAGWEKLHGMPPDEQTALAHPFELRCRPVLSDSLYVPVEAEDANVAKPDPSVGS